MKKRKIFILFIFIFSSLVLSVSIYEIIKWNRDNKETVKETEKIFDSISIEENEDSDNVEIIGEDVKEDDPYWDYIKMNLIDVDFGELKKINSNVKGWIQVSGTNINYPFVQTGDNSFYLTHSFDKSYNDAGWLFMDYRNTSLDNEKNLIIYGHGRLDKTMFGSLRNIMSSSWYNDINNHIIKLSTENENTLWQVFSVYHIPTTNDYIQTSFSTNTQYINFLNKLKDRSAYNFNTEVNSYDKILTLSTCYSESEKVVLHAKLIKRENKE